MPLAPDIAVRDPERFALLAFLSLRGVGPAYCGKLREQFGSLAAALEAGPGRYLDALRGDAERDHESGPTPRARAAKLVEYCVKRRVELVFRGDATWPTRLDDLGESRPELLFVRGKLDSDRRFVAVVGTRHPDCDGPSVTQALAKALARAQVVTISGGAEGIDTAAHQGALAGRGPTWAVLGAGFEHPYPRENAALFDQIAERGALISEFPPEHEVKPGNFRRRNKLVAALSEVLVVVQGDLGSGALTTALEAETLKRTLMAVPGRTLASVSRGPHLLLRAGRARICGHSSDVLHALGLIEKQEGLELKPKAAYEPSGLTVSDEPVDASLEPVLRALGPAPRHLDDLAATVSWPASQLLSALTQLELLGLCEQRPGKLFVRRSG